MYQSSHILDEKETIDILYNYYNPYNAKFVDLMYDTVKDDPMELIYPMTCRSLSMDFANTSIQMGCTIG